ncbi:E2 [human papillomavirus 162]|uniref:Regulatory protein E2 n=1 Tax=human papillomavirus 162 TaxID=1315263 RepID=K4MKU6_9PAPI|nr:E2 [human papillomavirus 162]
MENRVSLTERFAALQENLMTLYERDPTDLYSQIQHWDLVKKENEYYYYARKEGMTSLGMFPAPALQVSEAKAKDAIKMLILLRSLNKSPYASEVWKLKDTSVELVLQTEPRNCFKKGPFEVEVWFDNNPQKALPYPCWQWIYYQDHHDIWHKVKGAADYNGTYYEEVTGDRVYFALFDSEAARYGESGQWTVRYNNQIISASVTSSSRCSFDSSCERGTSSNSIYQQERREVEESGAVERRPTSTSNLRRRRGGEQGEPSSSGGSKRRRADSGGGAPSPEEVGRSHRSVERRHLTRLGVLQAEARDPPIALITGGANSLKCWRRRVKSKHSDLFVDFSTNWTWVGEKADSSYQSKMLVAFSSVVQREAFVNTINLPKGATLVYGQLNSL